MGTTCCDSPTDRRLEVPGLEHLEASSVYYAATETETQLCRGEPVTIVGGGNAAGQAAVFLSRGRLRSIS